MTVAPVPLARAESTASTRAQWAWLGGGALLAFLVPFLFADLIGVLARPLLRDLLAVRVCVLRRVDPFERPERGASSSAGTGSGPWRSGSSPEERLPPSCSRTLAAPIRTVPRSRPRSCGAASCTARPTGSCSAHSRSSQCSRRFRSCGVGSIGSRTIATGALALAMAFAFTAVYHAGYSEFRSSKIATPIRGTAFWTAPTLLTLNPLGAPIAHIAMHVTAVTHNYQDGYVPATALIPRGRLEDPEVMAVMRCLTSDAIGRQARPLLGVRRQPGRLALAVFRLPLPLYRRGWGWLLGHTFLLVVHAGRKTGKLHSTVAMALTYDPETHEAVICSVWGENTDWVRNIRARPAVAGPDRAGVVHTGAAFPLERRELRRGSRVPTPTPVEVAPPHMDPGLG